jgi:virginiamycin B lyase
VQRNLRSAARVMLTFCAIVGLGTGIQSRAAEKPAQGSVISGKVRDQQNSLYGIAVKAGAEGKNVFTSVFTDDKGEYSFPPLPPGNYVVSVGAKWQEKVALDSSPVKRDFVVELGPDFVNQTSGGSLLAVLPGDNTQKKNLVNNCGSCHSVWRPITMGPNSPDGWAKLVRRMGLKKGGEGSLDPAVAPRVDLSDNNFKSLVKYYSDYVTPNLKRGHIVEAMFRPRGEGAKAVFTEWNLPKELGGINTAKPDSKGMIWFPSGQNGLLGRVDPRTGEVQTWQTPVGQMLKGEEPPLHDIMIDKEDNVWLTGGGKNKIVKFDTQSLRFMSWDIPDEYGYKPHTGELDENGNYWFTMQTGKPGKGWVVKLDPRTGKVTGYATKADYPHPYGPEPYGLAIDKKGTIWFTELFGGKVGKIDPKSGEMTEYSTPDPTAGPRRLALDSKGNLWFTECFSGKIARLDPSTMKFDEYDLGVAGGGFPYSIRIDKADQVWFTMNSNNSIGKLDPKSKKITYSLFPIPETNTIDPGFDLTAETTTLVYGTHRPAVGRIYFRQ